MKKVIGSLVLVTVLMTSCVNNKKNVQCDEVKDSVEITIDAVELDSIKSDSIIVE